MQPRPCFNAIYLKKTTTSQKERRESTRIWLVNIIKRNLYPEERFISEYGRVISQFVILLLIIQQAKPCSSLLSHAFPRTELSSCLSKDFGFIHHITDNYCNCKHFPFTGRASTAYSASNSSRYSNSPMNAAYRHTPGGISPPHPSEPNHILGSSQGLWHLLFNFAYWFRHASLSSAGCPGNPHPNFPSPIQVSGAREEQCVRFLDLLGDKRNQSSDNTVGSVDKAKRHFLQRFTPWVLFLYHIFFEKRASQTIISQGTLRSMNDSYRSCLSFLSSSFLNSERESSDYFPFYYLTSFKCRLYNVIFWQYREDLGKEPFSKHW